MKGWVYIITNKSMPNLLNIGFSNNDPVIKVEQLNNSEIPHPYVIEYDALLNEPKETAQKIQAILSHCHENKGWFRCEVAKAIIAIRQAAADSIIVQNNRNAEVKNPEIFKREPAQQKPEVEKIAAKSLDIQDLYAAVIGDKNTDYYLAKFAKFDKQKPGLKPSWNWPAFLFTGFWALYRKMYGCFFAIVVFITVLNTSLKTVISHEWIFLMDLGIGIIFGYFADSIYHELVKKKITVTQLTIKNENQLYEFLYSKGGVHSSVIWIPAALLAIGFLKSFVMPELDNISNPLSTLTGSKEPSISTNPSKFSEGHNLYTQKRYAEALPLLQKEALEQGNVTAQVDLGLIYYNGNGVTPNHSQAAFWYRKAAEQGSANGQFFLGLMLLDADGITRDYNQANFWIHKAAEQGDAPAQYFLGEMYFTANFAANFAAGGATVDYTQAVFWISKAAEQGYADAQYSLGRRYLAGKGVTRDDTQAIFWLRKAANQGNSDAIKLLKASGQ